MYMKRWRKVKTHLRNNKADAFIFKIPSNIRYLYASHLPHNSSLASFLVVPRTGRTVAVTSSLEAHRTSKLGADKAEIHVFSALSKVQAHSKSFTEALKKVLKDGKAKNVLCDSPLKIRGYKLKPDNLLIDLRQIKDPFEIRMIRKACSITDKAGNELPRLVRSNSSERKIHMELNYIMKSEGADSFAFETTVASGPHSAFPHHDLSDRKFKKGDPVTCDFGAVYRGYTADLTRTHFVGQPSKRFKDIYNAVYESQKAGIKAVKSGVTFHTIDKACRDVIDDYGFGEYYVHSTGHGMGLDVHEEPRVSPGNKNKVRKGMVFTIEPGIYIPKLGGVRIEDDILASDRAVVLNKAFKPRF